MNTISELVVFSFMTKVIRFIVSSHLVVLFGTPISEASDISESHIAAEVSSKSGSSFFKTDVQQTSF